MDIFDETVNIRLTGHRQVKRGVKVPEYLDVADLRIGQKVRLITAPDGQPYIAAYFDPCGEGAMVGPRETCTPPPTPRASAEAQYDSWYVSWRIDVDDLADYYIVYANDENSSDGMMEIGSFDGGSATIPFDYLPDSSYRYFSVRAVRGSCKSGLHWATGNSTDVEVIVTETTDLDLFAVTIFAFNGAGCQAYEDPGTWSTSNGSVPSGDISANLGGWPGSMWWGGVGSAYRTTDAAATWPERLAAASITDPPNTAGDSPAPTLADLSFTQAAVIDSDKYVLVAEWANVSDVVRGWLLITTDNLSNFTWKAIGV